MPEKITFCKECVISNQRPRSVVEFKNQTDKKQGIFINPEDGICDACKYNKIKTQIDQSKENYEKIIDNATDEIESFLKKASPENSIQ